MIKTLTAGDVMSPEVTTVPEDMPVQALADLLTENRISGAPVANLSGRLIGVVSQTDIARSQGSRNMIQEVQGRPDDLLRGWEGRINAEDLRDLRVQEDDGLLVRDIMTSAVYEVDESAPLKVVADTMLRGNVHRLFVKRGDKVAGVITTMDLLKVLRGDDVA